MELVPWTTRREMGTLRRDMEDLMSRFFRSPFLPSGAEGEWVPSVDIRESDGEIQVDAELPGLNAEDIDLNVSGDLLTLRGEKKEEHEEKEGAYTYREMRSGSFQRSIRLPSEVHGGKADARFKNGVLTVRLPKAEEAKSRRIEIKQ
jgi:HSP20 family protein